MGAILGIPRRGVTEPSSTMLVTFRKISAPDTKAKNTDLLTLISGQQTQESKISNGECLNLHLDRTTTNAQRSGDGGSSENLNRVSSKPSPVRSAVPAVSSQFTALQHSASIDNDPANGRGLMPLVQRDFRFGFHHAFVSDDPNSAAVLLDDNGDALDVRDARVHTRILSLRRNATPE